MRFYNERAPRETRNVNWRINLLSLHVSCCPVGRLYSCVYTIRTDWRLQARKLCATCAVMKCAGAEFATTCSQESDWSERAPLMTSVLSQYYETDLSTEQWHGCIIYALSCTVSLANTLCIRWVAPLMWTY